MKTVSVGLLCAFVQLATAHATSVVVPPPCAHFIPETYVPGQPPPPRKRMIEAYLAKDSARCVGQFVSRPDHAGEDIPVLVELMRKGESAELRRQAAEAMGWQPVARVRSSIEELSSNISDEVEANVVSARIRAAGQLLRSFHDSSWDSEIRLSELFSKIDDIDFNGSRSDQDKAEINAALVEVLAQQLLRLSHMATWPPDERKIGAADWQDVVGETSLIIRRHRGDVQLLEAMDEAFGVGTLAVAPEQEAAWLLDLIATLEAAEPEARAAASGVMRKLLARLASRRDPEWQDFQPYLNGEALARLATVARSVAENDDASVRANAVGMIGILGSAEELVAALDDGAGLVRESAALALARQTAIPASAVPRLMRMAQAEGEESLAAIAALSQVRSAEVMQVLLDLLLKPYSGTEFEKKQAASTVRALGKFGLQAALPILARAERADDEFIQQNLYAVLLDIGWERLGKTQAAQVAEALMPALRGENEISRLFALSLLARLPVNSAYQYPNTLVDPLVSMYLWMTPKEISKASDVPADVRRQADKAFKYAWNSAWSLPPQIAVSMVAGHSASQLAAQRMVAWLCAAPGLARLHNDFISHYASGSRDLVAVETMGASLNQMGALARPLIEAAQAKDSRKQCKFASAGVGQ
jgi:uncharacterized protein (UPF0147 family)